MSEPAHDGLLQAAGTVEAVAADGLAGNQPEPALDEVQPRGTGRGEVQLEVMITTLDEVSPPEAGAAE